MIRWLVALSLVTTTQISLVQAQCTNTSELNDPMRGMLCRADDRLVATFQNLSGFGGQGSNFPEMLLGILNEISTSPASASGSKFGEDIYTFLSTDNILLNDIIAVVKSVFPDEKSLLSVLARLGGNSHQNSVSQWSKNIVDVLIASERTRNRLRAILVVNTVELIPLREWCLATLRRKIGDEKNFTPEVKKVERIIRCAFQP